MIRTVQFQYNDETNVLSAVVPRQDGTGIDVVWSTTDTTPPMPWINSPLPAE